MLSVSLPPGSPQELYFHLGIFRAVGTHNRLPKTLTQELEGFSCQTLVLSQPTDTVLQVLVTSLLSSCGRVITHMH